MNRAVIAIADQVIVQELRSRLEQSDADIEVAYVADSTQEMVSAVLSHRPALIFVHDQLGPSTAMYTIRDLTMRNPSLAVLMVTTSFDADTYNAALDAGARGVLTYPFNVEDVNQRVATALDWSQRIRAAISDNPEAAAARATSGARIIAVAGAKGGVGATIIASHLAWDAATTQPNMRVCLVDLDVENGDVPSYLDVSHRVSLADLSKISADLTARAVADTVVVHSSGLHLLLAPTEIRDTEYITPEAVRRILAQLRTLYHLVIVDAGSAITTTQAAAVESADVTLQIVTADVPALRAARRQVVAWESLGVASADAVRVVVNRFVRQSEIQQDTIDMLTLGERSEVLIPDLDRGLERAGNSRTPAEARNGTWWRSLRAIGQELDTGRAYREALAAANRQSLNGKGHAEPEQRTNGHTRPASKFRRLSRDAGSVVLENVAMVPIALVVLVVCLQFVLLGLSFVWSGVAANAAARAAAVGTDPNAAARDVLPPGIQSHVTVASGGAWVQVQVRSPLLMGNGVTKQVSVDVAHTVVEEPR